MFTRVASLRRWLLVAMLLTAIAGLGGSFVIDRHIERSSQRASDFAETLGDARTIAAQVKAGAGVTRLAGLQRLLTKDRLTVRRGGVTIFQGRPEEHRQLEFRAVAPFPGGSVELADYQGPGPPPGPPPGATLDLMLITAGVLALVIIAVILTATLVTRAVRGPVGRAIDAAQRLSDGDLSARMGSSGPEELVKLGHAFDSMAARLERVDRDQRQFLADVAHEIATPLNAISGFGLALADGEMRGDVQRAEARTLIQVESERLHDLLSDLRELTRLDLAEGVRIAPLELMPFARDLVARFAPTATSAGLKLSLSGRAHGIRSDRRLLDTIASNLLSNAIRYTPRGGRVEIHVRQHRDHAVLAVRDNGIGIELEHQQRIFERLYRVDGARNRATGGSGLGLAIAHRAALALGGHIECKSEPGQGSEFRLILPTATARVTREDEVSSPA